jgi:PPOX class probable F420-dependent enzyme
MDEAPPILTPAAWSFVAAARRATLATTGADGRPRLVPVCFVLAEARAPDDRPRLYSPLDEKPKQSSDPLGLARVRDLLARPEASLLVDRWDEDWSRLGWVRLHGHGAILHPAGPQPDELGEHAGAVAALRAKHPQYLGHALERRPLIRILVERATSWGNLGPG